jgi:hypothetical protein
MMSMKYILLYSRVYRQSVRAIQYSTLCAGGVIVTTTVAISSNSRKPVTVTVTVSILTYPNTANGMIEFF